MPSIDSIYLAFNVAFDSFALLSSSSSLSSLSSSPGVFEVRHPIQGVLEAHHCHHSSHLVQGMLEVFYLIHL